MAPIAKIYVIPGSHACRTGMLLLDHKGIDYRVVELPTGLHPQLVRLLGFPGRGAARRTLDGATNRLLTTMDSFGTVPAVRIDGARVQTNIALIEHLEAHHPDPPLFPADPELRREVQEALLWGDDVLQMSARRLVFAAATRSPDELQGRGSHGRLGPLLSHSDLVRNGIGQVAGRMVFRADPGRRRELQEALPAQLDVVDAYIAAGVLDGPRLNAADLMVAPSLALLCYVADYRAEIEPRPAGALMQRVLPETPGPGSAAAAAARAAGSPASA